MDYTIGMRAPRSFTAGEQLARERPNPCGYRDRPVEKGDPSRVAEDMPKEIQERLSRLNLRSIDSEDLRDLVGELMLEGYVSQRAATKFSLYHLDHPGKLDLTQWIDAARADIKKGTFHGYPVALQGQEAGIDAAEGILKLVDYLNGRLVDVHA
ncbi:hypothetical protein SAMN02800691_3266 [Luteibacter sp. UNCMF366Tsu5.1]|nr:hypothetical protein SAMN02800691_3266 [Luteibacter sp. UNCMF366Tsu5.1]